ncbi:MAG: hypothetical protein ACRDTJ_15990 [Pseudonocardiaceae bacterium]
MLELGDPDEAGMRRVALTEAGLTHYRVLYKRQRCKDLVTPSPDRRESQTARPETATLP